MQCYEAEKTRLEHFCLEQNDAMIQMNNQRNDNYCSEDARGSRDLEWVECDQSEGSVRRSQPIRDQDER